VLWNNDAADPTDPNQVFYGAGARVLTFYNWDGTNYVYSDHAN
jgi:hypothetical protein